jgi:tRNA-specific 2-thiouridylase
LKRAGYDVVGLFMKNWEDDDDDEYCSTRQDFIDAAAAADVIGIEFEAVNFATEYKERVFAEFLREYQAGRTPNPDVLCNAEIKFKAFLDHAMRMGAAKIATGHYARVEELGGRFQLLKGCDPGKDQSYFLHRLTQAQLSKALFPVGHLMKSEVRALAATAGLPNHAKKDSTGICFIGERPFREFLSRYLPRKPGPMLTPDGEEVGTHQGLMYYTLGQRQGLGIGGRRSGEGTPWFVVDKRVDRNELVVVQGHDHPLLQSDTLSAANAAWIAGDHPSTEVAHAASTQPGQALAAKTRYRQQDAPCTLALTAEEAAAGVFHLRFERPQWAVTPGQSAVLYAGDVCLGGGIIR